MGQERVAIVTGGGRGMGRAIASALADQGTRTVVASRTPADLEATAAAGGGSILSFACDASVPEQVDALMEFTLKKLGAPDILVCAQGVYEGSKPAFDLSLEQFDRTMAINLTSCFYCAQSAGRAMRDAGKPGRIVFISSMNGLQSQTQAVDYDVSKAALLGLARALAVEWAPVDITVNAIAPGWVRTAMSEDELEHLEGEGLIMNPVGKVGTPEQIAKAALWLTDGDNEFVTGTTVTVDGGQTAMLPLPWKPEHATGTEPASI